MRPALHLSTDQVFLKEGLLSGGKSISGSGTVSQSHELTHIDSRGLISLRYGRESSGCISDIFVLRNC